MVVVFGEKLLDTVAVYDVPLFEPLFGRSHPLKQLRSKEMRSAYYNCSSCVYSLHFNSNFILVL